VWSEDSEVLCGRVTADGLTKLKSPVLMQVLNVESGCVVTCMHAIFHLLNALFIIFFTPDHMKFVDIQSSPMELYFEYKQNGNYSTISNPVSVS
jgi:hypothetical protein